MKNPTIIPINDELQKIHFLYIENDPALRDIDKDCLESCLGGMGAFAELKDYDIDYHFNAYSSNDTFSKITKADFILLNTSFTGASGDLLYNFLLGAIEKGLKNKIIINCTPLSVCSTIFNDMKEKIKALDEKQNISFYFNSSNMNAFIKYENNEGFTLG